MAMRILTALLLFVAVSLNAANLIPNSSFEVGAGRGWYLYGTGDNTYLGEDGATTSFLTNGVSAPHGGYAIIVEPGARLYARPIWLTTGDYMQTVAVRCPAGLNGSYSFGILNGSELYQGALTNLFSASNTWAWKTNFFHADSNSFYYPKVFNFGSQPAILVDAMQIESGTSASAYAPMATVELGLSTGMTNNAYFSGDTKTIKLNFRNEGSAAPYRARYQIHDAWNSNVVTADVSVLLNAATNMTVTVSLPARTGWFRAVSRLSTVNDSWDEMPYNVYPFPFNITRVNNSTNDWLGGQGLISEFDTRKEAMVGRRWERVGPGGRAVRWSLVEPSRDTFDYADDYITNYCARNLNVLGILCDFPDGTAEQISGNSWNGWPTWATNADGTADFYAYQKYCSNTVYRYKDWIHTWEIWNEPYQSGTWTNRTGNTNDTLIVDSKQGLDYTGTNKPINVRVATNYSRLVAHGIAGITNADPTARIVIMSGAFGDPGFQAGAADGDIWSHCVWTNLTANLQSWVWAVSTHIYPKTKDPNEADSESFTLASGWADTWRGVRPVMMTEGGIYYNAGSTLKTLNGLIAAHGDYSGTFNVHAAASATSEPYRNDPMARQLTGVMRNLCECLRCVGIGFTKYFYYSTVPINDETFAQSEPFSWDMWQVDVPWNTALSVAQSIVRAPGFGRVTNAIGGPYVFEAYMFTDSSGNPVVAAWSMDRTNRTLYCSDSRFEVLDCMSNLIQTNVPLVKISRIPVYIRSGTLSITELSNTVGSALATNVIDALPPQLSFDIAPSGLWDGSTNATLIKWTPIDDTFSVAIAGSPSTLITATETNVMCRWSLDGAPYTSNTQSNHFWPHHLSAGNHNISVQTFDRNGNTATYSYDFVPPESTLNCNATFNAGTIVQP